MEQNMRKGKSALSLLGWVIYVLLAPDVGALGSRAVGLGLEFHPQLSWAPGRRQIVGLLGLCNYMSQSL